MPEARKRVFEIFTQADATVLDRYGGSGLGLAIVDRLVRCMGGEVGIEGDPAIGSTFWVSVDVEPDAEGTIEDALPPGATVLGRSLAKAEILAGRARQLGINADIASTIDALVDDPPRVVFVDGSEGDLAALVRQLPVKHAIVGVWRRNAGVLPENTLRERIATLVHEDGSAREWRNALRIAATRLPVRDANVCAVDVAPAPMRILVADDNRVNRTVMAKLLECAGHTVVLAGDGHEALEILTSEGADIALLDVNMPVLNGIEAAQSYSFIALSAERRIPLIGLTADASPATSQRCREAGMASCLVKPVRLQTLLRALEHSVSGQEPSSSLAACAVHEFPAVRLAPIDRHVLAELTALGGQAFVEGIVRDFVADTERVIAAFEKAAIAGDAVRLRAEAHALCSSAANVGALALQALCETWQRAAVSVLSDTGPALAEQLRLEWQRTRTALRAAAATMQTETGSLPGLTAVRAAAQGDTGSRSFRAARPWAHSPSAYPGLQGLSDVPPDRYLGSSDRRYRE